MASKRLYQDQIITMLRYRNNMSYTQALSHAELMMRRRYSINEQTYYNYCHRHGLYVRQWERRNI